MPGWKNDNNLISADKSESDSEDREFTDSKGNLKSGKWGMKEMLTCANFLRKNTPEALCKILSTGYKKDGPPLLEILCGDKAVDEPCCVGGAGKFTNNCSHTEGIYKNKFGIRIYLRKPKDLAMATEKTTEIQGVKFGLEKVKLLKDDKNKPLSLNEEIPSRILLVDDVSLKEFYENDPKAPCKIMVYDNPENKSKIDDNYYLKLYERYILNELWPNKSLPLIVNNLETSYYFSAREGLSIGLHENDNHKGNIFFVSHPEKHGTKTSFFNDSYYFLPISGSFSTKAKLYNNSTLDEDIRKNFYQELREAAITKVVIVDERISSRAQKQSPYFGKDIREILKKMNVYVVEIKVKDNRIKTTDLKKELETASLECFKVFESNKKDNAHFFVIHQGILEKLDSAPVKFMEEIKCRWKIVDSGWGVPDKMLKDVGFVELSALQAILANYDKHGLVQTLFSLRRPKTQEENDGYFNR